MWPFGKSTKARLKEALKEQKLTSSLDLDVDVKKKNAIISGEVPNERYKKLLEAIAEGINGIEGVNLSGITVPAGAKADSGMSESQEDPSAKAKAAYAKIRGEGSLANNPVDVLQKGDTIVLRGAVDSQEEFNKAKELAMSVDGVSTVDTNGLQVIQNAAKLNVTDDDGDIVYTVASGDTLSHIALNYYGDAGRGSYMKIAEANGIDDPNKIQVGQQLKIPGTTAGPEQNLA